MLLTDPPPPDRPQRRRKGRVAPESNPEPAQGQLRGPAIPSRPSTQIRSHPFWVLGAFVALVGPASAVSVFVEANLAQAVLVGALSCVGLLAIGTRRNQKPPTHTRRWEFVVVCASVGLAGAVIWIAATRGSHASTTTSTTMPIYAPNDTSPPYSPRKRMLAAPVAHVLRTIPAGVNPLTLAASGTEIEVLTQTSVLEFGTASQAWTTPFAVLADPSALAVDASHTVVVGDGVAGFYDEFGAAVRPPIAFAEAPGCVALTGDIAWLCNASNWKLDRVDVATGSFQAIGLQYPPAAIAVTSTFIWVSTAHGELERIDRTSLAVTKIPIDDGSNVLAAGLGMIWIVYPDTGRLLRFDTRSGHRIGPPTHVAEQSISLAFADGYAWGVTLGTNELEKIDAQTGQAVGHITLKAEPQGLVASGNILYAITAAGSLVELAAGMGAPRHDVWSSLLPPYTAMIADPLRAIASRADK